MQLVKCQACGNDVSPAAQACPRCGHPFGTSRTAKTPPLPLVAVSLLGVALVVLAVWAFAFDKAKGSTTVAPDSKAATVVMPKATHEPTVQERLDVANFASAVAIARPFMTDTTNDESPGAALLALWATKHIQWSDVAVTTDETSNALAKKDPSAARGKRVCTSGTLIEIHVDHSVEPNKLFYGLLDNGGGGLYRFYAAKSTGALVDGSWARFCGVVTGLFDYSNSGGGVGHAVAIVGVFDLPDNHPAPTTIVRTVLAPEEAPNCEEPFITGPDGKLAVKPGCDKK